MKKFVFIIFLITALSMALVAEADSMHIVVNKAYHLLFVENGSKIVRTIPVTIGKGGESETPTGTFSIASIVYNPKWYFNGKVYPPYIDDPKNGLGVCWMGISLPSYGIHGTNEPFSPGRNRSHGCVRMNNSDILYLSKNSFIGEKVVIEEGFKNDSLAQHLKKINLLYDLENIMQNSN